jgi:hypothetical protein
MSHVYADQLPEMKQVTEKTLILNQGLATAEGQKEPTSTQYYRSQSKGSLLIGYEPFTTWIPSKKTLSYTHIFNKKYSLEFEYGWSQIGYPIYSIDLGSLSEKRFSLVVRHYLGNSFHFLYGIYRNDFYARLGGNVLNHLANRNFDSFRVNGIGASGGIGNRWQYKNGITLGIDWFRMNLPLVDKHVDGEVLNYISDESTKNNVNKVIQALKNVPTFVLLGFNIGYTF